jgi:hypothetical protein
MLALHPILKMNPLMRCRVTTGEILSASSYRIKRLNKNKKPKGKEDLKN